MLKWEKTGREVRSNGETTIWYEDSTGKYVIESRKKAIPHNGREGFWMYTSYFLTARGKTKEYFSLTDAKAAAEDLDKGGAMIEGEKS